jgi:nicotinamidase/pyrazinamidase
MTGYDASTALVVVDLQNDFADPTGSLFVQGGDALVARINEELERAAASSARLG